MIGYRIARRKYADLRGEGARLTGGRFNPPGIPAVYTSQSIALALLEILVHIDKSEVPGDYIVMAIRFAGKARRSRVPTVLGTLSPAEFRTSYYNHPVLRVPAVIVPREDNFVLLPEANGFAATVEWIEPLMFDRRLLSINA